jgi:hypothetical protein
VKFKTYALAALLAGGLWMSPAMATITFTLGNVPQDDEINILFEDAQTGTTITGEVDHSGVDAIFSSLTGQTLCQNAQGQADVNGCGEDLTSMSFTLGGGYVFGDFIMNLQNGTGTATVTVLTENSVFNYALGNGQNFLTIVATGGDVITEIQVTMSSGGGFSDFKQPRISSVCNGDSCVPVPPNENTVPEPGVLSLLGIALLGFAGMRRRIA